VKKIVVIDDDKSYATFLFELLKKHGYDVHVETDGSAGFETIKKELPDLIVSDIRMGDITGFELFNYFRDVKLETRIILITAFKLPEHEKNELIRKGVSSILYKPNISDEIIINHVKRALTWDKKLSEINPEEDYLKLLLIKIDNLEMNNDKLKKDYDTLYKKYDRNKLLYLIMSVILSTLSLILLRSVNISFGSWAFIINPIIFMFLIFFPIENIKKLYAKTSSYETTIDIDVDAPVSSSKSECDALLLALAHEMGLIYSLFNINIEQLKEENIYIERLMKLEETNLKFRNLLDNMRVTSKLKKYLGRNYPKGELRFP